MVASGPLAPSCPPVRWLIRLSGQRHAYHLEESLDVLSTITHRCDAVGVANRSRHGRAESRGPIPVLGWPFALWRWRNEACPPPWWDRRIRRPQSEARTALKRNHRIPDRLHGFSPGYSPPATGVAIPSSFTPSDHSTRFGLPSIGQRRSSLVLHHHESSPHARNTLQPRVPPGLLAGRLGTVTRCAVASGRFRVEVTSEGRIPHRVQVSDEWFTGAPYQQAGASFIAALTGLGGRVVLTAQNRDVGIHHGFASASIGLVHGPGTALDEVDDRLPWGAARRNPVQGPATAWMVNHHRRRENAGDHDRVESIGPVLLGDVCHALDTLEGHGHAAVRSESVDCAVVG